MPVLSSSSHPASYTTFRTSRASRADIRSMSLCFTHLVIVAISPRACMLQTIAFTHFGTGSFPPHVKNFHGEPSKYACDKTPGYRCFQVHPDQEETKDDMLLRFAKLTCMIHNMKVPAHRVGVTLLADNQEPYADFTFFVNFA